MSAREEGREELARVGRKLLRRMEELLDRETELDLKDLKTFTGALKELNSLWDGEDSAGGALTVCFQGETEEMSL